MTVVAFAFVATLAPFEERLVGKLDMMNEAATILIIDVLFIFTDNEPSVSLQYKFGFVFIGIVVATLSVHIFLLLADALGKAKQICRITYLKRKAMNLKKNLNKGI